MRTLFLSIITFFVMSAFVEGKNEFEISVRESIERQIKEYPESTLKDLYKSFFQDRFGPGHIISNVDAVRNYLIRELDSPTISGKMTEPTGWQHNFYRVNLLAIKENLISSETLLDAFVRSANTVEDITIEEWKEEWSKIESIIRDMNLSLPGYETELQEINDRLKAGRYVGHHSEAYTKAHSPHYRIISKKIFEEELLPLLK